MIRVGVVNASGTIGRRTIDALRLQPDMKFVGCTKNTPDFKARLLAQRGVTMYTANQDADKAFLERGIPIAGSLKDLLREVDVVVDTSPRGTAEASKQLYDRENVKVIFQGSERGLCEFVFVACCNFDEARGRREVRVASCNTTAICRAIAAVNHSDDIDEVYVVMVKRSVDPTNGRGGLVDAFYPDPLTIPTLHSLDVKKLFPHADVITAAVRVPVTHFQFHTLYLHSRRLLDEREVLNQFEASERITLISGRDGINSSAQLLELGREMGRPRGDIYENLIWEESIHVDTNRLFFYQVCHQEANVVPENVDAIRAIASSCDRDYSVSTTNSTLGITNGVPCRSEP
jgi:glyceraldehyde-3-phosphate dehydrogenase (NAD(P))